MGCCGKNYGLPPVLYGSGTEGTKSGSRYDPNMLRINSSDNLIDKMQGNYRLDTGNVLSNYTSRENNALYLPSNGRAKIASSGPFDGLNL